MKYTRKATPVVLATTLALTLAACAQSERDSGNTDQRRGGDTKDTFTFGAAGAPEVFDPFYATDGETFRVTRQMFEGLVGIKAGTADIEPELAEKWEPSAGRQVLDLHPAQGREVHRRRARSTPRPSATTSTACSTRTRRRGRPGRVLVGLLMGGFKRRCRELALQELRGQGRLDRGHQHHAPDLEVPDHRCRWTPSRCSRPRPSRPVTPTTSTHAGRGLRLPGLLQEPRRHRPVQAREVRRGQQDHHPGRATTTTGARRPRRPRSSSRSSPTRARVARSSRPAASTATTCPNPVDWKGLKDDGNNVLVRPAFNILYLGLNPEKNPKLKDLKVRQALYYALNRDQLVKTQLPEGAKVATQFMPETVDGYNNEPRAVRVRPGEGQVAAQGGRRRGHDAHVRLPVRGLAPVHAEPAEDPRRAAQRPREGRHQGQRRHQAVERRLPRRRRRRPVRRVAARLDR